MVDQIAKGFCLIDKFLGGGLRKFLYTDHALSLDKILEMVSNESMFFRPRFVAWPGVWLGLILTPLVWAGGVTDALESPFFTPFDGDLQQAVSQARQQDKRILLFFGAPDCRYCHYMKQHVLKDPQVLAFYREHYLAFALDIRSKRDMRDESGQATNVQQYAQENRVRLTPTLIYFDLHGESLYRQTGYIVDPKDFVELGRSLIEDHETP